ncbi:MAG: LPS export ABC transporter periplasmic protein LptC [Flavobacteriales bacterium]|nr:LPS export ABC transporter periplasmic protein LptC [Flavobacteriales bacterium]
MMRFINKIFITRSIVVLLGIAMLFSCENKMSEIDKLTSSEINTDNNITNLDMIYTDSGIVKLRLKAPIAIIHDEKDEPYKEFPVGLEVFFFKDRDTVVENYLRANYGINYEKKDITEVRGDVVVVNEKGDTLKTEKLFWDSKKKLIFSEELVRIIQKDQVIIGEDGFEADESFSYYSIKNSSGDISVDDKEEGK